MAHIGKHNEKRSYERQPKVFNTGGYFPKQESRVARFQRKIAELVFEIHEFKNLGFEEGKEKEIENVLAGIQEPNTNTFWYIPDRPSVERSSKAKKEYTCYFRTILDDSIWVFFDSPSNKIIYWIE